MTDAIRDLSAAIQQLEDQNRRLKRWGLAAMTVVCLALGATALALKTVSDTLQSSAVTAEEFVVRSASGRPRASLGMSASDRDMVTLKMMDEQGGVHIVLQVTGGGLPGVTCAGSEGRGAVMLGVDLDDRPWLDLRDVRGASLFRKP